VQLFERKLKYILCKGVNWIQLAPEKSKTGPCNHTDEPSSSTKGGQFFGLLNDYQLMGVVQSDKSNTLLHVVQELPRGLALFSK
jgi:hypothetical protein